MRFVNEAQLTNRAGSDGKDLMMCFCQFIQAKTSTHDWISPRFFIIDAAISCHSTQPCSAQVVQEMAVLQNTESALKPFTQHVGQASMMITGKLKRFWGNCSPSLLNVNPFFRLSRMWQDAEFNINSHTGLMKRLVRKRRGSSWRTLLKRSSAESLNRKNRKKKPRWG